MTMNAAIEEGVDGIEEREGCRIVEIEWKRTRKQTTGPKPLAVNRSLAPARTRTPKLRGHALLQGSTPSSDAEPDALRNHDSQRAYVRPRCIRFDCRYCSLDW
jgi:hypothetical protein